LYAIDSETKSDIQVCGKHSTVVPVLDVQGASAGDAAANAAMVIVPDSDRVTDAIAKLKKENSSRIVAVRLTANKNSAQRIIVLAHQGVEVVNIVFDTHGREFEASKPRHMRDVLREVHTGLVKEKIRDEITLISSGGVGLPEHMAKAIICGADCVAIDIPLILAMECRLCGECERGEICQVDLENIDEKYATRRVINLMGAWHSQLLEMLGAMGIREARRLRGEVGRCMFFEDLEKAAFGRIFGKRKDNN
jgi:hypothetical protein